MKKVISLVLSFVCLALVFVSCAKQNKNPATEDVVKAIKGSASFTELIALTDDNIGRRYYGIDLDDIEEYSVYVCASGALADEIAVFKLRERDDVEDMLETVRERKQELYDSFVDYVPDEVSKIENATVASNGNYVYFIVCKDRAAAKSAAEGCF